MSEILYRVTLVGLVLLQDTIAVFSVRERLVGKTPCAANGRSLASAATPPTGRSRAPEGWACQRPWTALRLLPRATAIAGEARLARGADRPTEYDNSILQEH